MRLVFRPEAQQELLEAQAWYEARSPGLGFEFARAIDAAIEQALRMPLAFPRVEAEFRQVMTRRFPY
jgi:plasmid stabilization system protein ParE